MLKCSITQLYLTLCDPKVYNLLVSSVYGIFQARILEWVVIPFSGDLPNPGIKPTYLVSPALAGWFFATAPPGKPSLKMVHIKKKKSENGLLIRNWSSEERKRNREWKEENIWTWRKNRNEGLDVEMSPGWGKTELEEQRRVRVLPVLPESNESNDVFPVTT